MRLLLHVLLRPRVAPILSSSLEQLAGNAPEGYKTLARLRAAAITAEAGDLPAATSLWTKVSSDSSADGLLREFAALMAIGRELDRGNPAQLESRLRPVAESANPWSSLAREQLAMLALRQDKVEDARKVLRALSIDVEAPAGLRARAGALLASLGPGDSK